MYENEEMRCAPAEVDPTSVAIAREATSGEMIKGQERASKLQTAMIIAKRFPRDEIDAERKIKLACSRPEFAAAKDVVYLYPRGGESISGPGIRMAEMMARAWGNMRFGFEELSRDTVKGESLIEAYAWDLESNVEETRTFVLPHKMIANKKVKHLTDPRDLYEYIANNAKRRQRDCILHLIPKNVVDAATAQVRSVRRQAESGKVKEPLVDQIKKMVFAFSGVGVNQEMLEARLRHKIDLVVESEISEYLEIFNSIKDGETKRGDWFKFEEPAADGKAAELNEKFAKPKDEVVHSVVEPGPGAFADFKG